MKAGKRHDIIKRVQNCSFTANCVSVCFMSFIYPIKQSYLTQSYSITWHTVSTVIWTVPPKHKFVFSNYDASFANTTVIFSPLSICIPARRVVVSGQGEPSRDESCVSSWCRRLLLRRSSSGSLWTLVDRINRTHVARAACLLGFGKSNAILSE